MEEADRFRVMAWTGLLLVVGVLGAYYVKSNLDAQASRVQNARESLASLKATIELKGVQIEAIKKELSALKQQEDLVSSLGGERVRLENEITGLESNRTSIRAEFVALIKKVRSATIGMEAPNLVLADGRILKGAKIKTVGDIDITILHDQGALRVPFANLPSDLKQRFWIGREPIAGIDEANLKAAPAMLGNSVPLPAVVPDARPKRSVLEAQIRVLQQQRGAWDASYREALSRELSLRSKTGSSGTISARGAEAARAAQNAAQFKVQMDAVDQKIVVLRNQLPGAESD